MPARRRKRRSLERKYMVRRLFVLLVPVALIVLIVALLTQMPETEKMEEGSPVAATEPGEEGTEEGTGDAAGEETEPETEPEPVSVPWNLLLINSQNEIPEGFEEGLELEDITGNYQVDRRIIEFYADMSNQAKADGVDLMICSAYRSVEKQTELFDGWKDDFMAEGMSEEEAEGATLEYTNRPGTSEHHTGLALDIVTPEYQNLDAGYAETAAARWLVENAAEYGFILRYPEAKESITQVSFEPWHYRYVGTEAAKVIMEEGLCLEEYLRQEAEISSSAEDELEGEAEPTDETAGEDETEPEEE